MELNEQKQFWRDVFLVALRDGNFSYAELTADRALLLYRNTFPDRNPKEIPEPPPPPPARKAGLG